MEPSNAFFERLDFVEHEAETAAAAAFEAGRERAQE
jgi:hypothetical protein